MSETEVRSATSKTGVGRVDMKLEVQIIPVSDVDRSKGFYERLGWRLDDDYAIPDATWVLRAHPHVRARAQRNPEKERSST